MTSRVRVVVADDEPAGRRALHLLLARDPDVELVAECRTGSDAAEAILRYRPDLVFLDVRMPGGDGFEVLAQIPAEAMPLVVFVTAFQDYSLRAFDVHAADYLLKPFSDGRFRAALAHAKERLRQRAAADVDRLESLRRRRDADRPAAPLAADDDALDRLVVRTSRGALLLAVRDIDWIEARGDYVRIHSAGRTDLLREPIGALEARLDPRRFVRIHRSAIVNLAKVRELKTLPLGGSVAVLDCGVRCRLSESGRDRLARALGRRL